MKHFHSVSLGPLYQRHYVKWDSANPEQKSKQNQKNPNCYPGLASIHPFASTHPRPGRIPIPSHLLRFIKGTPRHFQAR